MGFTLKVEGNTTIELGTTSITGVKVSTDIPQDSNARSTDLGSTITVTGKILTAVDGDPFDATRQLGLWALVPAENSDCYRKVTVEVLLLHRWSVSIPIPTLLLWITRKITAMWKASALLS